MEGLVDLVWNNGWKYTIQIKTKKDMLNQYGITIGQFNEFVDVAFAEKYPRIYEGNKPLTLMLRFDANKGKIENIKKCTMIDTHDGKKTRWYYVADVVAHLVQIRSIVKMYNVKRWFLP